MAYAHCDCGEHIKDPTFDQIIDGMIECPGCLREHPLVLDEQREYARSLEARVQVLEATVERLGRIT